MPQDTTTNKKTTDEAGGLRRIEVFRPGTFRALSGQTITYTAADVAALADNYDPETNPAPVVVGHPKTDSPAYGWVKRLHWDADAERLYAEIGDIAPEFEQAVREGRYKRISISLFPPASPANPRPGKPYLKHVGFLGGAAPAVPGLKPVSLGAWEEAVTIELSDPDLSLAAGMFRRLRDWIIAKFGLEEADAALPGHVIEWMEESQRRAEAEEAREEAQAPAYAAASEETCDEGETDMSKKDAELERLKQELAAREARLAQAEAEQFADALVAEGRLPSGLKEQTAALIATLETGGEAVSFANGNEQPPAQALKALLKQLPKMVEFGEAAPGEDEDDPAHPADFAAPDGYAVDPERMALHRKALAWMRQHGSDDYAAALDAVSNG